jgi:hypothetical protein
MTMPQAFDDRDEAVFDPELEVERLLDKIAFNKKVIIAVLCISTLTFCTLTTAAAYFYSQLNQLKNMTPKDFELRYEQLHEGINEVANFRDEEREVIARYQRQLADMQQQCTQVISRQLPPLHSGREQDTQALLALMQTGSRDLAAMAKGSKQWLSGYQQQLSALQDKSHMRQQAWQQQVHHKVVSDE